VLFRPSCGLFLQGYGVLIINSYDFVFDREEIFTITFFIGNSGMKTTLFSICLLNLSERKEKEDDLCGIILPL
jgi:hypothetical protein